MFDLLYVVNESFFFSIYIVFFYKLSCFFVVLDFVLLEIDVWFSRGLVEVIVDSVLGVLVSDGGVCIFMFLVGEVGGVDWFVSVEVKYCVVFGGVEVMVFGVVVKEGGVNDNGENVGFRCIIVGEEIGVGVDVVEGIVVGCLVVVSCLGWVCV